MFFWIIQNIIISVILIMSIHYIYIYFKTNLTVPKTKDLVKKPIEQYKKIYHSIQQKQPDKIDQNKMKGELKKYLKSLKENTSSPDINTFNSSNTYTTY